MIHILVITEDSGFQESLKVLLPENEFRLHPLSSLSKALPLLKSAHPEACLVDTGLKNLSVVSAVEAIRRNSPAVGLFICTDEKEPVWEEEAYLKGADFIFRKPLRGPLVNRILEKHLRPAVGTRPKQVTRPEAGATASFVPAPPSRGPGPALPASALEIMRDFSRILSYSLDLKSFVHQFILKLREVISVNRVAILLRKPDLPFPGLTPPHEEDTDLECICSIGIEVDLFQYFQLNLAGGIGGTVARSGQILKADYETNLFSEENYEINREFELLGCEVAIPIVDRERCLGLALIGGRLTGAHFSDEELQLLFHLMEELGLAIRNNWLHEELASNHELISDVIAQFKSGCLVMSPELQVLHANPALHDFMQKKPDEPVAFSDLPPTIACQLYEVVQKGHDIAPFMFADFPGDNRIFRISIFPLQTRNLESGTATMLLMEDFTQIEKAKKVEIESHNAQTIALIAERFAHEIRNALVPLSTHHQLLESDFDKEGFRNSLYKTMDRQIRRISRFADQMLLLSQSRNGTDRTGSLKELVKQAFAEARHFCGKGGILQWDPSFADCRIRGDLSTLRYACMEILLNALQSEGETPEIAIRNKIKSGPEGNSLVTVDFLDQGAGFSPEAAEEALKPFFTTRNVGVGLGLTVAEKILRSHGGSLQITQDKQHANRIRATLPLS